MHSALMDMQIAVLGFVAFLVVCCSGFPASAATSVTLILRAMSPARG